MTRLTKRIRTWATLVAVYALVLHTVLAGLAGGALASPGQLDALGNVICSSAGLTQAPAVPGKQPSRSHLPECCLAGCPAVGGHVTISAPVVFPFLRSTTPLLLVLDQHGIGAAVERSPRNPRAPPLAA
jgi:hypothetical protein